MKKELEQQLRSLAAGKIKSDAKALAILRQAEKAHTRTDERWYEERKLLRRAADALFLGKYDEATD